jgi:predicted membrane chloride channel (bestrophin family)
MILVVYLTACALLGREGAAEKVESPFLKDHPNHLSSMDTDCLLMLRYILQLVRQDTDHKIRQKPEYQEKADIKMDVSVGRA